MPVRNNTAGGATIHKVIASLIFVAILLAVWRDIVQPQIKPQAPPSKEEQSLPLLSTTIMTPDETAGATFTIQESRQAHILINRYSGSRVVINELNGPVVYTFDAKNYEGDRNFAKGTYVVSVIRGKSKIAKAFIEVK